MASLRRLATQKALEREELEVDEVEEVEQGREATEHQQSGAASELGILYNRPVLLEPKSFIFGSGTGPPLSLILALDSAPVIYYT